MSTSDTPPPTHTRTHKILGDNIVFTSKFCIYFNIFYLRIKNKNKIKNKNLVHMVATCLPNTLLLGVRCSYFKACYTNVLKL